MVTQRDYTAEAVAAARSVMIELAHLLGQYRQEIVIVGGWVPDLLLPDAPVHHIGSTDVDLALDHRRLQEVGYRTIHELLVGRQYVPDTRQPFIYRRTVPVGPNSVIVQVDLLAGEYEGTGAGHRTQHVQDVRPRKARGCDLAFTNPIELQVEGPLPGGAIDRAMLRVAALAPFIVMKAMALGDRIKEKDAYDIYYCVRYAGIPKVIESLRAIAEHNLVQEALHIIAEKFASPVHLGPRQVADFLEEQEPEARAILERDAFERVQAVLVGVGTGV